MIEKERLIKAPTITAGEVAEDDYIMIDSPTLGVRKYLASKLTPEPYLARWDFSQGNNRFVDEINGFVLEDNNVMVLGTYIYLDTGSSYLKIPNSLMFNFNGSYQSLDYEIDMKEYIQTTVRCLTLSNNWGNSSDKMLGLTYYLNSWGVWIPDSMHKIDGAKSKSFFDDSKITVRFEKTDNLNLKISVYKNDNLLIEVPNISRTTYETMQAMSLGSFRNAGKQQTTGFRIKQNFT